MRRQTRQNSHRYAAFISYAHTDERVARRIHAALETYPLPSDMDDSARDKLAPIFRDVTELTAHHSLTEKIQEAVKTSRFLIVLCSPAAKVSHWVNEEIKLFRRLHGEGSILSVIVDGTPETAFPPSLTEDGREPLAANMTSREGFRFGITQLAASMLGVGLDRLVQRDSKRRRNRLKFITAGALAFAAIMGALSWAAMDARKAAETSRTEAENMVEYLITDLKTELDAVGRLSILDDIGARVTDYYDAISLSDMDDDRLARQARARHILGQVALDQRHMDKASSEIEAAYNATQEVLARNPDNTDAIFAHAQSAFWRGNLAFMEMDYQTTQIYWTEYDALGSRLYEIDPDNLDWIMEAAWGQNNLGLLLRRIEGGKKALEHFEQALELFEQARKIAPEDQLVAIETANTLAGKSHILFKLKLFEDALDARNQEIALLENLKATETNKDIAYRLILTKINYWEIKNTISQTCHIGEPINRLSQLESFHEEDASNKRWQINYLAYWRDFLAQCRHDIPDEQLKVYIDKLVIFSHDNDLSDHEAIQTVLKFQ